MAAFSSIFKQHPFHHQPPADSSSSSVFLPNSSPSTINSSTELMCPISDEPNNALSSSCFSRFDQNLDHSTQVLISSALGNNINYEDSVFGVKTNTDYKSRDSSGQLTPKPTPMDKKRKSKEVSSPNCVQSKDMREMKGKKQKKMKDCEEKKAAAVEADPSGYIHVRARRGQATDSHSLAERVRRERISERMKLLQSLVPGCDKVTGKALMLDEIINYVQSLQNQVEFLSMKLASVNPMFYDFGMDLFMVGPEQNLSSLPSPLTSMQESSPTIANPYPDLLDINSAKLLLQQAQIPNVVPQGHRQVLWEVEDQRQRIINQSGISNTLFAFH